MEPAFIVVVILFGILLIHHVRIKQQKVRMAKEGFDPSTLSDPLYILDQAGGAYLPLTPARYSALLAGDLRI